MRAAVFDYESRRIRVHVKLGFRINATLSLLYLHKNLLITIVCAKVHFPELNARIQSKSSNLCNLTSIRIPMLLWSSSGKALASLDQAKRKSQKSLTYEVARI